VGCPLVVHYWADLQSGHGLRCYGNITPTLVTSLRPSRDMTTWCERPAGRGLRVLLAADWRVTGAFSKLCAVYGKWTWLACRWLAVDGGRSQHYCGGLDCGLPLMAFCQQKWTQNASEYMLVYSLYASLILCCCSSIWSSVVEIYQHDGILGFFSLVTFLSLYVPACQFWSGCLQWGANDLCVVQLMPLPSHHLLFYWNPDWFSLSGAGLPRFSWKTGR